MACVLCRMHAQMWCVVQQAAKALLATTNAGFRKLNLNTFWDTKQSEEVLCLCFIGCYM